MRLRAHRAIWVTGALGVALALPVIPVQRAPVVPDPVYSLAWTSAADIALPLRVGVTYRLDWASALVMLGLMAAAVTIGLVAAAKLHAARHT